MATEAGRSSLIGNPLACVRCDRHDLPEGAEAHEETALFDETTVPPALLQAYATGQGVWSRFEVLSGSVRYVVGPPVDRAFVLNAGDSGIIAPALVHRVELVGPTRFRIVFYREC